MWFIRNVQIVSILLMENCFVGQVNNLLCLFVKLDSLVKCRLFTAYSASKNVWWNTKQSSFYGSELWNVDNSKIDSLRVAWRKGMRRVWCLPADTSSDILYLIADSIPIYDELCRWFINFVHSALNSEYRIVECVVRHGLCISPMKSPIGCNAVVLVMYVCMFGWGGCHVVFSMTPDVLPQHTQYYRRIAADVSRTRSFTLQNNNTLMTDDRYKLRRVLYRVTSATTTSINTTTTNPTT